MELYPRRRYHSYEAPVTSRRSRVHVDLYPDPAVLMRTRSASAHSQHADVYSDREELKKQSRSASTGRTAHIDLYPDPVELMYRSRAGPVYTPNINISREPGNILDEEPPAAVQSRYATDDVYFEKMQDILSAYPCIGVPSDPSPILSNVYVGTSANAENLWLLRKYRISYILNCAGGHPKEFRRLREMYAPEDTGIMGYEELDVADKEGANIIDNFARAHKFIDYARSRKGRVLIHCPGVSRSGAVAMSYLIANGQTLLQAVRAVKNQRRVALCNHGFMKQLIMFARHKNMLDWDVKPKAKKSLSTTGLDNPFYRYRVNAASIQRIINTAY